VRIDVLLDLVHDHVVMRPFAAERHVGQLAGPVPVNQQKFGGQVRAFAGMLTELTGQDLPQWIASARDAALPGISSFAKGLEQDLDAVTCGLTMPWSSGPVEGRVNLRDDQAPDVRPRRTPAPPQARPAHRPNPASGPKNPVRTGRPTAAL
jgi:hypothetical protein